jgi:hypothetical protein
MDAQPLFTPLTKDELESLGRISVVATPVVTPVAHIEKLLATGYVQQSVPGLVLTDMGVWRLDREQRRRCRLKPPELLGPKSVYPYRSERIRPSPWAPVAAGQPARPSSRSPKGRPSLRRPSSTGGTSCRLPAVPTSLSGESATGGHAKGGGRLSRRFRNCGRRVGDAPHHPAF